MFSRRGSLFDFGRGRLAKGQRRNQDRRDRGSTRLGIEALEERRLLAVINWTNRGVNGGADNDNFQAVYGNMAEEARAIVDRAINDWEAAIIDFNYGSVGGAGEPAVANTFDVEVTADATISGRGVADMLSIDPDGKPFAGRVRLDDDGGGQGWFFDVTPEDDAEFIISDAAYRGSFNAPGAAANDDDFYRTVTHEIGHLLGISNSGGLAIQGLLTDSGMQDANDNTEDLLILNGASGVVTFTTDGGLHIYEGPIVGTLTAHPNDLMNPGRTVGAPPVTRQLISPITLQVLSDAYGYNVAPIETLASFTPADQFESDGTSLGNDTRETAVVLGSPAFTTLNGLSIDNPDDEDWFEITANQTGLLIINALFDDIAGDGHEDLDLEIYDTTGALVPIATSTSNDSDERIVVPVVGQERYAIRIFGVGPAVNNVNVLDDDVNNYSLEIENFTAPAPAFVDLSPSSDTGISNSDNVTSDTTPTFLVQADLVDFRDRGITLLDQATIDPNNDGDAADATDDGAGVFVTLVNLGTGAEVEGFANQLGASGFLWNFTPSVPLPAGEYFVSSAVQIVDGQMDPSRENGRAQLSDPLFITIIPPNGLANISADLLAASDTGMFNDDNVTNKMSPAIQGIAPAGSTIRLFANGELVGQTVTGSDSSDDIIGPIGGIGGDPDDGLGLWEITTEPLADGAYDLRIEVEDLAGNVTGFDPNFSGVDGQPIDIVLDTEAPNTPLLDLQGDTGEDLSDEIVSDATPTFFMTTTDPNVAFSQVLFTDNFKFRLFDRLDANPEVLVYDSAADAVADAATTAGDMFTSLTALTRTLNFVDGTHNLKLEVEDRAGNISHDFLLEVVVDTLAPVAPTPNLLDSSDTGMFNNDNVTSIMQPAFDSTAEINTKVTVFAQAVDPGTNLPVGNIQPIGSGTVGSDATDGVLGNDLGLWEVTVEPLADGAWDITTRIEDWAGNLSDPSEALRIVVDTEAPNTPLLDLLDDTGRHDHDNITKDNQPQVFMTSTDPNVQFSQVLFTDNYKFRLYDRFEATAEILIYDSASDVVADNVTTAADMFTSLTSLTRTIPSVIGTLADGVHNLKLEVEDRAGNISPDFLLQIEVDTVTPLVSFGLANVFDPDDGLAADSDSGVTTDPATFADRVTSDTTPRLWGRAEANTIVDVYLDRNADGIIDLQTDTFLGQTVAVPIDGNDAFQGGYWELVSALDLNEIVGLPKDGLRSLLVTAQDVAGNPMPMNLDGDLELEIADGVDQLNIFIDTQGPQVYDPAGVTEAVHPAGFPAYDLFDPKPSENGFTPLTRQITINFQDLPARSGVDPNFRYEALQAEIANIVGNYSLVGDHVGTIGIVNAIVTNAVVLNGQPATATVDLVFADFLPDDRYTLTVSSNLVDPAGNNLDGESNASGPLNDPTFPSGDGVPGGDFVARFTIDSRPEIGSFVAQNINIDTNGNFVWDPANGQIGNDATNVDLTFTLNVTDATGAIQPGRYGVHDLAFAGKFTNGNAPASGNLFDQVAAFGFAQDLGYKRWLIDTDSDGVINTATGDILSQQLSVPGFDIAGALPIAGNFDGNAANGDEIGLYYRGQWAFDTNGNFTIDLGDTFVNNGLLGQPIIGDFDGDGFDDAGVFNNNVFYFDMAATGGLGNFNGNLAADQTMIWGFPGVLDRAVATDMDQDGIDDIGLWVPRNSAQDNRPIAEWYFLLSNQAAPAAGSISAINHPFTPVPFGADLYAEFGDELSLPIVGNFDPPVTAAGAVDPTSTESGDFDQDGDADGTDFLAWQRATSGGSMNYDNMMSWTGAYGLSADSTVDPGLAAFQANYGNGSVSGSDFLAWQRQVSSTDSETSQTQALAAVASPTELIAASTAYVASLELAAKAAAFEALEQESTLNYAENSNQYLAAVSAAASVATEDEDDLANASSSDESDVWELIFSDEELLESSIV